MANNIFGIMGNATTGMMGAQVGLDVVSNNINGLQISGYTRQRALLESNRAIYYQGVGHLGNGIYTQDIQRIRDEYLDVQRRDEMSSVNEYTTLLESLQGAEGVFTDLDDNGLNKIMNEFWDTWEELSKNPDKKAIKESVKEMSQLVTDQLNRLNTGLEGQLENLTSQEEAMMEQTADLITQLNDINTGLDRAHNMDPTKTPNELLDERDRLLDRLAQLMPIETTVSASGSVGVSTVLEDGTTEDVLAMTVDEVKAVAPQLTTGAIKGNLEAQAKIETDYQGKLDTYAKVLADEVNAVQGFNFFVYDAANPAESITVNPGLLDGTQDIVTGTGAEGDNSVVLEMLELRKKKHVMDGESQTFDDYYNTLVSTVGTDVQKAESSAKNHAQIYKNLDERYQSISGVSLDEEVLSLVQYQKAYEASAKVISTLTDMLDTIINGLGV